MRTAPRPTGSAPAFARWLWLNCPGFLKHPVISRFFMRGTGSPIWDIPYKNGDSLTSADAERCSLDLYLPSSRVGFPTLVWFHGGGFIEGHKSELTALKLASRFCRGGVAAATVGYRLSPTVTYPAYIEDGASALAWVYGNIDRLGGDSSKIFVSGHSAGAYLAALIALDSRYLARHGLGTDSVAGLIVISGQMGTHTHVRKELGLSNQELIVDRAAPLFHVGSASPPVLCI